MARASGSADPDAEPRAADGRVPGRRGRATRQRLLDCTLDMLDSTSYRDIKVVDIARGAGMSPATFYQYFPDVEAAILVMAEDMAREGSVLAELVREPTWKGKGGWAAAVGLVDGFLTFWEEHRAVLRVVELATNEGDQRFRQLRTGLLNQLTNALAELIGEFQRSGRRHPDDEDPMATAAVLVAMLASVASHRYGMEFWGIRANDTRSSMAEIIYWSVTRQKPPG